MAQSGRCNGGRSISLRPSTAAVCRPGRRGPPSQNFHSAFYIRPEPHESHRKFHNFLQHGTLLVLKSLIFLVSLLELWKFRALVPGCVEVHLLCHVTLFYCQGDPNPKPKAKSEAKSHCCHFPYFLSCDNHLLIWTNSIHPTPCRSSKFPPMWFQPYMVFYLRASLH